MQILELDESLRDEVDIRKVRKLHDKMRKASDDAGRVAANTVVKIIIAEVRARMANSSNPPVVITDASTKPYLKDIVEKIKIKIRQKANIFNLQTSNEVNQQFDNMVKLLTDPTNYGNLSQLVKDLRPVLAEIFYLGMQMQRRSRIV